MNKTYIQKKSLSNYKIAVNLKDIDTSFGYCANDRIFELIYNIGNARNRIIMASTRNSTEFNSLALATSINQSILNEVISSCAIEGYRVPSGMEDIINECIYVCLSGNYYTDRVTKLATKRFNEIEFKSEAEYKNTLDSLLSIVFLYKAYSEVYYTQNFKLNLTHVKHVWKNLTKFDKTVGEGPRDKQVFICGPLGVQFIPPKPEKVKPCLTELWKGIKGLEGDIIKIPITHYIFEFIHPYMDGNGRTGRLIENAMLAKLIDYQHCLQISSGILNMNRVYYRTLSNLVINKSDLKIKSRILSNLYDMTDFIEFELENILRAMMIELKSFGIYSI